MSLPLSLRTLLATTALASVGASVAQAQLPAADCRLDGDILTVAVDGETLLEMASDWSATDQAYLTTAPITLLTAAGDITLPDVADVSVDCAPYLNVTGTLRVMPDISGLDAFGGSEMTTLDPTIQMGVAEGSELTALGAPTANDRPYLYFYASSQVGATMVEGNYTYIAPGEAALMVLDVTDPAFYVHLGGIGGSAILGDLTLGLVDKVGFGYSLGGNFTWQSTMPMWDGDREAPRTLQAHAFRAGKFGLIPIPNLPANLKLDGDLAVDLGAFPEAAEAVLAWIGSGDPDVLARALAAPGLAHIDLGTLIAGLAIGTNAHNISLDVGPLGITLAEGSVLVTDGAVSFAGRGFTPGEALRDSDDPILSTLSLLSFRGETVVQGFVDAHEWSLSVRGSIGAGPFQFSDATVIVDSVDGVRIDIGGFELDWAGFVNQLTSLMRCDFTDGLSCDIAGVALDVTGSHRNGTLSLSASADAGRFANLSFAGDVSQDGAFSLRVAGAIPLGLGNANGSFTLTRSGVSFSGALDQLGANVTLSGAFNWSNGDFDLSGTGRTTLGGFQVASVAARVRPSGISLSGDMSYGVGSAHIEGSIGFDGAYHLAGSGSFSALGYTLASVNVAVNPGHLTLGGRLDLAGLRGTLSGTVRRSSNMTLFDLSGSATLAVSGHDLSSVTARLSNNGLNVSARLAFLNTSATISGNFRSNGDFTLSSSGAVSCRVAGFSAWFNAKLVRDGNDVELRGTASLRYAGNTFGGSLVVSPLMTQFTGSVSVNSPTLSVTHPCLPDVWNSCTTRVKATGRASLTLTSSPYIGTMISGMFAGTVYVNGSNFMSVSMGFSSNGTISIELPFGDITLDLW